jgi:DNA modification methylase
LTRTAVVAVNDDAMPDLTAKDKLLFGDNVLHVDDAPVHQWYRFVLSYPAHLVRHYARQFHLTSSDLLLDPFCGTGTTLVESKKLGIPSVGCDAHPFIALASRVKVNWSVQSGLLRLKLSTISRRAEAVMTKHGLLPLSMESTLFRERPELSVNGYRLTEDQEKLLPTGFLSEKPLTRLLILRDEIKNATSDADSGVRDFFLIALAHVIANGAGNFAFGPEIYRTKGKEDYDVLGHFTRQSDRMIADLSKVSSNAGVPATVVESDARSLDGIPSGISAVITSPPYPNEKDYTRTTRVESLLLELFSDKASLRRVKEGMLRSNTRNIFVKDNDGDEVAEFAEIQRVCRTIERRRIELKKDSGFEKLYHKVVAHYFGGMRRHFRSLKPKLVRGAQLAYVVGDQFSFLMVPVPTAKLLGIVAESEGYRITGCDLWRERTGTKVRNDRRGRKTIRSREEVLLLTCE